MSRVPHIAAFILVLLPIGDRTVNAARSVYAEVKLNGESILQSRTGDNGRVAENKKGTQLNSQY